MSDCAPAEQPRDRRFVVFAAVGGLYLAQQVPLTLAGVLVPALFRKQDMPLEDLAWFSLPLLATGTRWLWAPAVDTYGWRRFGLRKSWIAPCTALGALLYAAMGFLEPSLQSFPAFIAILTVISFVMATQDIAVDAYIVENLKTEEHGLAARVRILATESGQLIALAGLMSLAAAAGWGVAIWAASALLVLLTLPALLSREEPVARQVAHVRPSLIGALSRRDTWLILAVVAVTSFPAGLASAVIGPFLVDKGLSIGEIGFALGIASSIAPMLSAFTLAPLMMRNRRAPEAAKLMLITSPLAVCGLLWLSTIERATPWDVAIAVAWGSFFAAPALILFYASRLAWTSKNQAGTEFTLQESIYYLSRNALTAAVAGPIAAATGWTGFFVFSLIASIVGVATFVAMHDRITRSTEARDGREALASNG